MNEVIAFPAGSTRFHVQSLLGRVVLGRASNSVSFRQDVTDGLRRIAHNKENRFGFGYYRAPPGDPLNDLLSVRVPHWSFVAIFAILAALPWITHLKLRFSLRTLLIAVTLIAVALGIVAISI
ncbi:MAG: hypothetical protein L0Z53_21275 [Acidobacteriales bacterium]|nr:hypothetical protein [Terriglobales bacterium]